jgi:hypothetical protein
MRRASPFVLAGVALFTAVLGIAGPARASDSANACVAIKSAEMSTGLAFDVENGCEKKLS